MKTRLSLERVSATRSLASAIAAVLLLLLQTGCNAILGNDRQWNKRAENASDGSDSGVVVDASEGRSSQSSVSSDGSESGTVNASSSSPKSGTTSSHATTTDAGGTSVSPWSGDTVANVTTSSAADAGASTVSSNETGSDLQTTGPTDEPDAGDCPEAECEPDDAVCVLGAIQACELGNDGCWRWSDPGDCPSATCANGEVCLDCTEGGDGCPVECEGDSCPALAGQACKSAGGCDEGRCQLSAQGAEICCTASCDSACQRCAADGESCVDVSDDDTCGVITCPQDDTCRNYTTETATNNRCLDGTCGTPEQLCPFIVRNEGEACSATHLCDAVGNCSVPKLALGAACEDGGACESDNCVDGVCCETRCDGVCMECRAGTGHCDVTPVDDDACSDVECSRWDADCTASLGNITDAHCAAFGMCKSELSCPIEYRPRGTPCAGHSLYVCDGAGECGFPTVECGQSSCLPEMDGGGIDAGCCFHHPDFDLSALECRVRNDCLVQYGDWSVACDEHADCRTGETVCCGVGVSGMGYVECTLPEECNIFASPIGTSELCESPAMGAVDCSNGGACIVEVESLPGFKFCTRVDSE